MRHRIAAAIVACAVLVAPAAADAAPFPNRHQMEAVRQYLKQRDGVVGVGVIDSQGGVRGVHGTRTLLTASVIKSMMLVRYLRNVAREDRALTSEERSQLEPMIRVSSNDAATWVYNRLGDRALRRFARRASMDQFTICCGTWGAARFSARDQAKFFWQLERFTPPRFRDYATHLLRSIVSSQSWGIPSVGRPRGFSVFFKGGWGTTTLGALVHQASFVRYRGTGFSLAVLTDGSPSMNYGISTIEGVARRVLRRPG